jgi:glycosyltransferase involved in cell wall biosynthesis
MAKIYHLLDESEPFSEFSGGAISRWVANVLEAGNETVICSDFDDSWGYSPDRLFRLPNWDRCRQVHPLLYRSPWIVQKRVYLKVLRPLLEKLKRGDILYIHNRPECVDALAEVAAQRGIRLVLHMQNSLMHPFSKKHLPALRDIPVVFCSEFMRQEVTSAYPGHFQRTYVVYNGADSNKFHADGRTPKAVPQIIFTGRLIAYKGVHVLLDAMSILERKGIAAKCTIVGGSAFGGSKPTRYVRKLERTKPSNTELVGYRSGHALAALLRQADIYCCPSIWHDPFPLAPLEAMASGLPVVAARMGGIPEALAHGGGILVPANDEEALAAALQRLVEDVPYRERLGREALQSFRDHFVWDNVRSQYGSVIRGLAS